MTKLAKMDVKNDSKPSLTEQCAKRKYRSPDDDRDDAQTERRRNNCSSRSTEIINEQHWASRTLGRSRFQCSQQFPEDIRILPITTIHQSFYKTDTYT